MVGQRPIELQELSKYFNMPEKAVAKTLGICLTSLKKLARQNGITRWPYRKIKSLDKKLRKLEVAMSTAKDDPSMVYAKWGDNETASSYSSSSPTPGSDDASMASTPRHTNENSPSPSSRLSPVSRPAGWDMVPQATAAAAATSYCSPVPVRVQNVVAPGKTGEPIKLELSLSPSMLQSVACGANNITFVVQGGEARASEASGAGSSSTFASSLMKPSSQLNDAAPVPAVKIEPACAPKTPVSELSDDEIIAMLAQCAGSENRENRSRSVPHIPDTTASLQEAAQALSDVEIMQALAGCCEVPHSFGYEHDNEPPRFLSMCPASIPQDSRSFIELDGADDDFHTFHNVFPCDGHADHFADLSA